MSLDLQDTVPRWQVHNEAALFWRAKGNGSRALQCLRQALSSAPSAHRHLVLTNAANLLLHHGLTSHAQAQLEQALALNASEVKTKQKHSVCLCVMGGFHKLVTVSRAVLLFCCCVASLFCTVGKKEKIL